MIPAVSATFRAEAFCGLSKAELQELVRRALAEDVGAEDLTTKLVVPPARARGTFYAQRPLVIAGLPVAEEVFRSLESQIRWEAFANEGAEVEEGGRLAGVEAQAATLLAGERVALNFLQHLSGVATLTREFAQRLWGLDTKLLDTRKTTPGLRALEKYAVRVGGGNNHRQRLDDGILIKNNHLTLSGGVRAAVERARQARSGRPTVEVEVRSVAELEEAIAAGADQVLLDNMTLDQARECVQRAQGRLRLEVSGGIRLENIRAYAESGVDSISVGALTHSAPAMPIHFLVQAL